MISFQDRLLTGGTIFSNAQPNYIQSGGYYLVMQADGNAVIYNNPNFHHSNAVYSTRTDGKGHGPYRLTMQADGNLVLYDSHNHPTFASNTDSQARNGPHIAYLSPSGSLELIDRHGHVYWRSHTSSGPSGPSGGHHQPHPHPGQTFYPGNELRSESSLHSHSTSTIHHSGFNLIIQQDGNAVIYEGMKFEGHHAVWASDTCGKGHGPYRLTMQNDGNLVVYDSHNHPTWASNTDRQGHGPYRAVLNHCGILSVIDSHNRTLYESKRRR